MRPISASSLCRLGLRPRPFGRVQALGLDVHAYYAIVTPTATSLRVCSDWSRRYGVGCEKPATGRRRHRSDSARGYRRTLLPTELGGHATHPAELVEAVARVAAADGSTGWCTGITAACNLFSGYVSEDAARTCTSISTLGLPGCSRHRRRCEATASGRRYRRNPHHRTLADAPATVSSRPLDRRRRAHSGRPRHRAPARMVFLLPRGSGDRGRVVFDGSAGDR